MLYLKSKPENQVKFMNLMYISSNGNSPHTTAYHAQMISIAKALPVVSESGNFLIETETKTETSKTPLYGDIQKIITLSTPSDTPFSQKKTR